MSDLSKVLGDLYGASDPDGPPVTKELSAEQRSEQATPEATPIENTDDLQSVLAEALTSMPTPHEAVVEEAEQWADAITDEPSHLHQRGALRAWTRSDDDFIPQKGRKLNHRSKK